MLIPRSHPWSRAQRWLIVTCSVAAIALSSAGIYAYERYHRGVDDSVFVGIWAVDGLCFDCTLYLYLQPDHTMLSVGEDLDTRSAAAGGRWYAGGKLFVIHWNHPQGTEALLMGITDISPDVISLRKGGRDVSMVRLRAPPPKASNQAMQRTAGRSVFPLSMTSTSNPQPRSPSPAVADLVSR
jgi:hypothetical protein